MIAKKWKKSLLGSVVLSACAAASAFAEEAPVVNEAPAIESAMMVGLSEGVTLSGYGEAHYGFDFNRPKGGLSLLRAFDQRSNTFTVDNAVLDVAWQKGPVQGRVGLQAGSTPSSYYRAEAGLPGTGVNAASNGSLWQNIQQAWLGYKVISCTISKLIAKSSGSCFVLGNPVLYLLVKISKLAYLYSEFTADNIFDDNVPNPLGSFTKVTALSINE